MKYYNDKKAFAYAMLFAGLCNNFPVIRTDTKNISKENEKKIRDYLSYFLKSMLLTHTQYSDLPKLIKEKPLESVLSILRGCHDKIEEARHSLLKEAGELLCEFPRNCAGILARIFENNAADIGGQDYNDYIDPQILSSCALFRGERVVVPYADDTSYADCLIFENGRAENFNGDRVYAAELHRDETGEGFVIELLTLKGESADTSCEEAKNSEPRLFFSRARLGTKIFSAMESIYPYNPWQCIGSAARSICAKNEYDAGYINEKEARILPFIYTLKKLFCPGAGENYSYTADPSYLQMLAQTHDAGEAVEAIATLCAAPDGADLSSRKNSLTMALTAKKYEPFWRAVYDELAATQTGLSSVAEFYSSKQALETSRDEIIKTLHGDGYVGEYPNFFKTAEPKGIKTVVGSGQLYFIAREKQIDCHITCIETFISAKPVILFVSGTHFVNTKINEERVKDAFSCMFNDKVRRSFKVTVAEIYKNINEDPQNGGNISTYARIAAKRAMIEPLAPEERRMLDLPERSRAGKVFLFGGFFFGLFWTLGAMAMEYLVILISDSAEEAARIIAGTHWWLIFLTISVPFGALMALFTYIAEKRR